MPTKSKTVLPYKIILWNSLLHLICSYWSKFCTTSDLLELELVLEQIPYYIPSACTGANSIPSTGAGANSTTSDLLALSKFYYMRSTWAGANSILHLICSHWSKFCPIYWSWSKFHYIRSTGVEQILLHLTYLNWSIWKLCAHIFFSHKLSR